LTGFVILVCVLGLIGYGAVRFFGITSHPGKAPELDALFGRGTSWTGTYQCGDSTRKITAYLLVAPKVKGDPNKPVDVAAALTFDPPGNGPAAKQTLQGTITDTAMVLTTSLTSAPANADHFLSHFTGIVKRDTVMSIKGTATSPACDSITMHSTSED
jgi:hypothetical protein